METSNAREELLRLTSERLLNKVKSTMYSINLILSHPEKYNAPVDAVTELLLELGAAESALNHSNSLLSQCLALKLQNLQSDLEGSENNEENN